MIGKLFGGGAAAVVKAIGEAGDRLFTSEEEKLAAAAVIRKLESVEGLKQVEVNLAEAKHSSLFVAGWRPAVGWIGATGLAMHFIILPLLVTFGLQVPRLDAAQLMQLVLAMLGFGAARSWERWKGIERK